MMSIQQLALLVGLLPPAILVVGLFWLDERDLRSTFKMFGTTGFWDVDRRMREMYWRRLP